MDSGGTSEDANGRARKGVARGEWEVVVACASTKESWETNGWYKYKRKLFYTLGQYWNHTPTSK